MKETVIALRLSIVVLAFFSVIHVAFASQSAAANASIGASDQPFASDVDLTITSALRSNENLTLGLVTEPHDEDIAHTTAGDADSASELNRKLANPVSSIWSIANQFNNFELNNGQWSNNWNFQPVLPVALTKNWNLITRPVMPFYNIVPHETAPNEFARDAGLGDLTLLELLSPANSGNWVLGAGPTAIFPTATSVFTGQGKWQLGPSAVVGYLTKQYFIGVFPQQWWSIGGEHFRADTNQMNLQPIATLFFRDGWSFGYSGNILADWTAPSPDVWTVPIGVGLAKVVKFGRLPVKIQLAVQYMPVHPRISGQEWNVQLEVIPVIPKLIKGALFQ